MDLFDFLVKNTKTQIRGKTSKFVYFIWIYKYYMDFLQSADFGILDLYFKPLFSKKILL